MSITLKNQVATASQLAEKPIRFDIINIHTKLVVGTAKTRARASQSADKRDHAYGAVRFVVKAVYA